MDKYQLCLEGKRGEERGRGKRGRRMGEKEMEEQGRGRLSVVLHTHML